MPACAYIPDVCELLARTSNYKVVLRQPRRTRGPTIQLNQIVCSLIFREYLVIWHYTGYHFGDTHRCGIGISNAKLAHVC